MDTRFAGDAFFPARAARTLHCVRCAEIVDAFAQKYLRATLKNVDEKFTSHYLQRIPSVIKNLLNKKISVTRYCGPKGGIVDGD